MEFVKVITLLGLGSIGLTSLSLGAAAPRHQLCPGIAPKNNLWIGVDRTNTGISEDVFNKALDKVVAVYDPIVQAHGFTLITLCR